MDWIHFVGKTYYTPEQYAEEATKFGASRRINPHLLHSMNWGDRIFLAQGDMVKKNRVAPFTGSTVFGYFTITTLGGVSQDALDCIAEEFELEITNAPIAAKGSVKRRCGHYSLGASIKKVELPLSQVLDYELVEEGESLPSYLLQGKFISIQKTALVDMGFRWGFRKFDGDAFLYLVEQGVPVVYGQMLPEGTPVNPEPGRGTLRGIDNYTQVSVYGPKSRFNY